MKQLWNDRYSAQEYIYGTEPSTWFKLVIDTLPPGKVLLSGAGEGRDAVYAAMLGWQVFAFDQSVQGKRKALQLAESKGVSINYEIVDVEDFDPAGEKFDLIALVFFHLPPDIRNRFHSKLSQWVTGRGLVLVEAFHPRQISNTSGGPKDELLLMTSDMLASDFSDLEVIENSESTVMLSEGAFHQGKADIVRFLGRKMT